MDYNNPNSTFICKNSKKNKTLISILILILILLSIFSGKLNAQQQDGITLSVKDVNLQEVLDKLEENTVYRFTYRDIVLPAQKNITISAKEMPIETFITQILANTTLAFKRNKNMFAIIPRQQQTGDTNISVKGNITDQSGEPLIGVAVSVQGTTSGTQSDEDGNFSITLSKGDILKISYIGFVPQEYKIGQTENALKIVLREDVKLLDEVVVVGYGTQRKGDLTSSIASIKNESFRQGAVQDAAQLLQGKVAGMGIVLPNGDPTSTTQIMLRGVGTLMSGSSPLIIVDGVPGDLNTVAPEDIESIDILKDGSAAAIYGTRGNNGVVFITTKKIRGGNLEPKIEVQSYITLQTINKRLDMMDVSQYRELVKQGKPGAIDYGHNINWLDEILRTPVTSVTNASFQGGNTNSNYIANINYKLGQGIIKESNNKVLTTRLEANHNMWNNLLKFNFNIMGREQQYRTLGNGNSFNGGIYRNALIGNPTDKLKDDNGDWVEHPTMNGYNNPVAAIYESDGLNKNTQIKTFGSVILTPIEQFWIKALVSHTTFNETRGYSETKKHISTIRNKKNGFASRGTTRSTDDLFELTGQYRQVFEKHNFTVLGGYSYQDNEYEDYWMENWDFPSDQYSYNNMGSGAALKRGEVPQSSYKSEYKLIGFFGRVNYNYDDRYLLSVSLRHEGSSKFGKNHKWGNFPAISAGWNLMNESFIKLINNINVLRLRAGFGITGTVPSEPYMSVRRLSAGDNFYTEDGWIPTLKPQSNANPDLRWEKKEEWNFGLDYGLYDNKVRGSVDYYRRKTKDLLWNYQMPMPPYLYPEMVANAGTLENQGIEIQMAVTPIETKDFLWNSTVNYSTNKNKLVSMSSGDFQIKAGYLRAGATGDPIQKETHRIFEGGKMGDFWGLKAIGVGDDGRWIIEGKDGQPKSIMNETPDDYQKIGNGLPKYFLSWDNQFKYKNFDLNITMRGAFGYDILNMPRMFYEVPVSLTRGNVMADTYAPRFGKVLSDNQSLAYVDYFIENGNFWKIDNVTLGYNMQLNNKYLKKVRLYLTGGNLLTITKYKGIDPEVNMLGLAPGCDELGRYPSTRSFTFGAMFSF